MSKKCVNFPLDLPTLAQRSKDHQSPSAKQTPQKPVKLQLDEYTYVTRSNGKLLTVRKNRPPTIYSTGWNLLREYFDEDSERKMDQKGKPAMVSGAENKPVQNQMTTPTAIQISPFDPNANLRAPSMPQAMMEPVGPKSPVSGLYQHGDRQLALLPLASPLPFQGVPPGASPRSPQVMLQQPTFAYPPPMIYQPAPVMAGYNFPPMGYDPRQFLLAAQLSSIPATPTSVTVTKHVCAKCGKVRSNKYHHYNPLKPGEVPTAAFCGKCEKDLTSTDVSGSDDKFTVEQRKRSKKRDYKEEGNGKGVTRSKDLSKSKTVTKSTSTKETRSTQTEEDTFIRQEELDSNRSKSINSNNLQIDRHHRRRHHHGERSGRNSQATDSQSSTSSPPKHSASKHSSSENSSREHSASKDSSLTHSSSKEKVSRGSSSKQSVQSQSPYRDDMQAYARFRAREHLFNSRHTKRSGVESISTNEPEDFYREQDMSSQPAIVKERRKIRKGSRVDVQNSERLHFESRNDHFLTRSNASTTTISSSEASRRREADLIAKDLGLQNGNYFTVVRHHGSPPAQRQRKFQDAERVTEPQFTTNVATGDGKPSRRMTQESTASEAVVDKSNPWDIPLIIISDEETRTHRQHQGVNTLIGLDRNSRQFATESAASAHYREDWSHVAQPNQSSNRIRPRDLSQGWPSGLSRQHQPRAGSESTIPPPAPTPPTASELGIEDYPLWAKFSDKHKGPYPFDPNEDDRQESIIAVTSSNNKNRKAEPAPRIRPASHYRPPYVRDATERDSEKVSSAPLVRRATNELKEPDLAVFPDRSPLRRSPAGTSGRARKQAALSEDSSGITEEIERAERLVTFQDITNHGRRSFNTPRRQPSWASRMDTML